MIKREMGDIHWADETPGQPQPGADQYGEAKSLWTTFFVEFICNKIPNRRKIVAVEARDLNDLLNKSGYLATCAFHPSMDHGMTLDINSVSTLFA